MPYTDRKPVPDASVPGLHIVANLPAFWRHLQVGNPRPFRHHSGNSQNRRDSQHPAAAVSAVGEPAVE